VILKQAPNGFGFLFSIEHSEAAKLCFFSFFMCVSEAVTYRGLIPNQTHKMQ
jgi:hypothetical protein